MSPLPKAALLAFSGFPAPTARQRIARPTTKSPFETRWPEKKPRGTRRATPTGGGARRENRQTMPAHTAGCRENGSRSARPRYNDERKWSLGGARRGAGSPGARPRRRPPKLRYATPLRRHLLCNRRLNADGPVVVDRDHCLLPVGQAIRRPHCGRLVPVMIGRKPVDNLPPQLGGYVVVRSGNVPSGRTCGASGPTACNRKVHALWGRAKGVGWSPTLELRLVCCTIRRPFGGRVGISPLVAGTYGFLWG